MKYNYIIVFPGDYRYYRTVFGDAPKYDTVVYHEFLIQNQSLLNRAVRKLLSYRILPRRLRDCLWMLIRRKVFCRFRKAAEEMAEPDKPLCLILFRNYLPDLQDGLYEVIKKEFPGSKVVLYCTDLVGRIEGFRKLFAEHVPETCTDLVCSYDLGESRSYGMYYRSLPYMDCSGSFDNEDIEYDVVFAGKNKGRLEQILRIWHRLNSCGLCCAVWLTDVTEEQMSGLPSDIRCCEWMQYEELLRLTAKARIILEIVQEGSEGNTLRVNEAVVLGKKLLSNNKKLKDDPLYDPVNMCVFEEPEDIPASFLFSGCREYPPEIKRKLSLQVFLSELDQELQKTEDRSATEGRG